MRDKFHGASTTQNISSVGKRKMQHHHQIFKMAFERSPHLHMQQGTPQSLSRKVQYVRVSTRTRERYTHCMSRRLEITVPTTKVWTPRQDEMNDNQGGERKYAEGWENSGSKSHIGTLCVALSHVGSVLKNVFCVFRFIIFAQFVPISLLVRYSAFFIFTAHAVCLIRGVGN